MKVRIGRSKKEILCAHAVTTNWDDGIDVELFEINGTDKRKTILLPEHTKMVRMFNDQGKEINRVEWKKR